jgi:hypothetical protein
VRLVIGCLIAILACEKTQPVPQTREQLARQMIEELFTGEPRLLVERLTRETTRDGLSSTGTLIVATTVAPADLFAVRDGTVALVGAYRRVAFTWSGNNDYVYVLTEHQRGDFVFMIGFDARDHLHHLTHSTPHRLPPTYGCSGGSSRVHDDGTVFIGPSFDVEPRVVIVGDLADPEHVYEGDIASMLLCEKIATIARVPADRAAIEAVAAGRLVVAHARDRAAIPPGADAIIVDDLLAKLPRDSGPNVMLGYHVSQPVLDRIVQRAKQK